MKRTPQVGDIIVIGKSKVEWLVVYAENESCEDSLRGDSYYTFVFKVIKYEHLGKINPKTITYHVKEGSSMSVGKPVSIDDVMLIEQVKVKETHSVVYTAKRKS